MEFSKMIGTRILVKVIGSREVKELKILEVSISQKWVKVMDQHGKKEWVFGNSIETGLVEILAPARIKHSDKTKLPGIHKGSVVVESDSEEYAMVVKDMKEDMFELWELGL